MLRAALLALPLPVLFTPSAAALRTMPGDWQALQGAPPRCVALPEAFAGATTPEQALRSLLHRVHAGAWWLGYSRDRVRAEIVSRDGLRTFRLFRGALACQHAAARQRG